MFEMVLILTRKDLESVLTMKDAIGAVERGFKELALGTARMPTRTSLTVFDKAGWMGVMPAYLSETGSLAAKIVTVYDENPKKYSVPTVLASITLNDASTGTPLAFMEGTYVTAMRTGAAGGVAAKHLARKDAKVAGIFGTGVQARTQLLALNEVRDIEKVYAFDILADQVARFSKDMSKSLGKEVVIAPSAEDVVKKSDVIVTATTSRTPVFNGKALRNGTHINAIGSFRPDWRELDDETILRSKVVVDSKEAALTEAGDLIIPIKAQRINEGHIYAEIGEIVAGNKQGRTGDVEVTLFKSLGLGVQDAAAAFLAYKKAKEAGVGYEIDLLTKT
jgi:ornithine cyclodeaminase/alanine dehydrogenase